MPIGTKGDARRAALDDLHTKPAVFFVQGPFSINAAGDSTPHTHRSLQQAPVGYIC
jgi:hypothetical protein